MFVYYRFFKSLNIKDFLACGKIAELYVKSINICATKGKINVENIYIIEYEHYMNFQYCILI